MTMSEFARSGEGLPQLDFFTIPSDDVMATQTFYSCLGFQFAEERHGKGPLHFSTPIRTAPQAVTEIYPRRTMTLGFIVPSLDETIIKFQQAGVTFEDKSTNIERIITSVDPDGRKVILREEETEKE